MSALVQYAGSVGPNQMAGHTVPGEPALDYQDGVREGRGAKRPGHDACPAGRFYLQ
jgi:hypothetical protein